MHCNNSKTVLQTSVLHWLCFIVCLLILPDIKVAADDLSTAPLVKQEGVDILRDIRKQSEKNIRQHCNNDNLTLQQCRTKLAREAAKTRRLCLDEGQPEAACYKRVQALWGTRVEPL